MPDEGATTGTTHDARLHASERAGRQLLRSCPGTSSESARPGCCSSTGAAVTCARANARSLLSWTSCSSAHTDRAHIAHAAAWHGSAQSARRCSFADEAAGRAPIARRRTAADCPLRAAPRVCHATGRVRSAVHRLVQVPAEVHLRTGDLVLVVKRDDLGVPSPAAARDVAFVGDDHLIARTRSAASGREGLRTLSSALIACSSSAATFGA